MSFVVSPSFTPPAGFVEGMQQLGQGSSHAHHESCRQATVLYCMV
jgi:hypothetical protein